MTQQLSSEYIDCSKLGVWKPDSLHGDKGKHLSNTTHKTELYKLIKDLMWMIKL